MDVMTYGDRWLLAECDSAAAARAVRAAVASWSDDSVLDVVPAARTALVACRDRSVVAAVRDRLAALAPAPAPPAEAEVVTVPVRYDGADLSDVAAECGRSVEEVVRRHLAGDYEVAFCGFAPGFGYLDGLDPALRVSRLATPRARVPAGAVAVADRWAAVYPRETPGGWRLLGSTDLPLWDIAAEPPSPLLPGTRVRFVEAP